MDSVETQSIYYNDLDDTFEDEDGGIEDNISDIMPIEDIIYCKKVGGTYYYTVGCEDFEVVFPINDHERSIYYDVADNSFEDEEGNTIYNIFSLISPNDIYLFKENKKNINLPGPTGNIELVYVDGRERRTWRWDLKKE